MRTKERSTSTSPRGRKGTIVDFWTEDDEPRCEACLDRPALGLLTLHTEDGHHLAAWWTCAECADHDAPIHTARGMSVSVWIPPELASVQA